MARVIVVRKKRKRDYDEPYRVVDDREYHVPYVSISGRLILLGFDDLRIRHPIMEVEEEQREKAWKRLPKHRVYVYFTPKEAIDVGLSLLKEGLIMRMEDIEGIDKAVTELLKQQKEVTE